MSRISKALITVAVIAALTGITEWLLGPQAAGPAFLVMCIIVGGYVGSGWGGRQAAKTAGLIGKSSSDRQTSSQKTYGPRSRKVASTQDQVSTKGNGDIQSRNTPKLNPQGCQ